jgi:DNA-binding NtrC family response regulator
VQIPPLGKRRSDTPSVLLHYINELKSKEGRGVAEISDDVRMRWPIRGPVKLKNLIEAAYANREGRRIRIEDLPEEFRNSLPQLTNSGRDDDFYRVCKPT